MNTKNSSLAYLYQVTLKVFTKNYSFYIAYGMMTSIKMFQPWYLIKGWVQSKNFSVAVGLALLFVVPVDLLIGGTIEKVREQGIREGVLQVKDAAGPAATWGVIYGH